MNKKPVNEYGSPEITKESVISSCIEYNDMDDNEVYDLIENLNLTVGEDL